MPVLPFGDEHPAVFAIAYLLCQARERQFHFPADDHKCKYDSNQHKGGLQGIGPHNRLYAATEGVKHDQYDEHGNRSPERDAPGIENE